MACIFVSYRRDDSAGHTGRICDRLAARFGAAEVFRDLEDIAPGDDFARVIEETLRSTAAAVVVIGPEWLEAAGADGRRRLDDPGDFVRLEVATSLGSGARVIPVLVAGARMPRPQDLPPGLQPLTRANAITIREELFEESVSRLIGAVEAAIRSSSRTSIRQRWRAWLDSGGPRARTARSQAFAVAVFVPFATILTRMFFEASPATANSPLSLGETIFVALCWLGAVLGAVWCWRRLVRRGREV